MRLVFAGTPAVALPTLRQLAAQHEVAAVITRPDAPLGRKRVMTPSPVAVAAQELGIPIIKAARLDEEVTDRIAKLKVDLGVIVAYGGLVRERLLQTPTRGWINLHFSLLPKWRGAAPVQRALIEGDAELGASVFQLVAALDAGDVFAAEVFAVPEDATADVALASLAIDGAELTSRVVSEIENGTARAVSQTGEESYAAKLSHVDGRLNWSASADAVFARYRGVTSEPGAHTVVAGTGLKVLEMRRATSAEDEGDTLNAGVFRALPGGVLVGTGSVPLVLLRVQPAGKGAMAAADWLRGQRADVRAE